MKCGRFFQVFPLTSGKDPNALHKGDVENVSKQADSDIDKNATLIHSHFIFLKNVGWYDW